MAIPTVSLSDVRQSPSLGPRIGGEMQATNMAISQAGNSIQDAGSVMGRYAMEKNALINRGRLASEENIRANTAAAIETYAQNNQGTPEGWDKVRQDTWAEYSSAKNARIKDQKWSPKLIAEDKISEQSYLEENKIRFNYKTDAALINNANFSLEATASMYMSAGKEEEAMKVINSMNVYDEQRKIVTNRVIYRTISGEIGNDPINALDHLNEKTDGGNPKNYKSLDGNQRLTLINEARYGVVKVQRNNYQDMIDGLANSDVKTPEQLQSMVDGKLLTPIQRNSYLKAYAHGNQTVDPVKIGALLSDIHNYDLNKDPSYSNQADLMGRIATGGFPTNVQEKANKLLGEKADPSNVLNGDVAKNAMRYIDEAFNIQSGQFKKPKLDDKGHVFNDPITNNPVIEVDQVEFQKANELRSRVQGGLTQFFRDNAKATPEEAQKYVTGFVMGDVQRLGASSIFAKPATTVNPTNDAAAKRDNLNALLKSLSQ